MTQRLSRRAVLIASATAGAGCLAGCQGLSHSTSTDPSAESEPDETDGSFGIGYSESRTSFPSGAEAHSGWVHIVSDGESADLTFDVRFCTELGDVEPELTRSTGNEVVLRFDVTSEFSSETPFSRTIEASECGSVTHLVGGSNAPSDWETLTAAVNDVEIQTVERSGTTPELRPLPDPVRPR